MANERICGGIKMFERFAIFFTPTGALGDWGAAWLGWNSATGCTARHPDFGDTDIAKITTRPRKYGLHGTLKAPFSINDSTDLTQMQESMADFAAKHARFEIGTMELRYDNGFVALRPAIASTGLPDFASTVVKTFDPFRAALTDADIARRRMSKLTPRQDQQLLDWGYPFIFDDFHFHLTLTGPINKTTAAATIASLRPALTACVPDPFQIDAITLMGQDNQGMFHQIHRYALTG